MRVLLLVLLASRLAAQLPPLTAVQRENARVLLHRQLPCLGCHELEGDGGHSAPSLTDVGQRRTAGYIRGMIEDPQRVLAGVAMPKTPMSAPQRELIVQYLSIGASAGHSQPTGSPGSAAPLPTPDAYAKWCVSCHGRRGGGDGPNATYLPVRPAIHSSAAQMGRRSDDALFDAISGGGAVMGKSVRMPAFGATLSPAEIRALVQYIRALCGCRGPAWSTDGSR